ncbi:MAG: metallophosphoesterase [Planctomycetes bacterium]|nr:metallophosphoesterase [Planctomycetota bacterium]
MLAFSLQQSEHAHLHPDRFTTDRDSPVELRLPLEDDAFSFAIFGDRTGGPTKGVEVLADAVKEVNVLGPDLVMTVGDLIEGYNQTEEWAKQADEFLGIMSQLSMPWFPVAGNHDVYWRGPNRPEEEHEKRYEQTFGPLWYAFEHKDCWFIVLYTDEPNPKTGERNFRKPESQRMSPEQFAWLEQTLRKTSEARHVFIFMHHPRWFGGQYGDDWERVHRLLAAQGNVSAVFAGHIHQMKYAGKRDGIEYFTLATVGGHQSGILPEAGVLHQYHLITVRDEQLSIASIPVGSVDDPRLVTVELVDACRNLSNKLRVEIDGEIQLDEHWGGSFDLPIIVRNPSAMPLEVVLSGNCSDPRWSFSPDHQHATIEVGETLRTSLRVHRFGEPLDRALRLPAVRLQADVIGEQLRIPLPERSPQIRVQAPALPSLKTTANGYFQFDGIDDHIEVPSKSLDLPQGAFTVEFRMRADRFTQRQGVVNKTENSEWGFFLNEGTPAFMVYFEGHGYVEAAGPPKSLQPNRWYHLAGVYDGNSVRLYIDGKLISSVTTSGTRRVNDLPLIIGADVDGQGRGTSWFAGSIDELRISQVGRYTEEIFVVPDRHNADTDTLLLLKGDDLLGPWARDYSLRERHPQHFGGLHQTSH